VGQRVIGVLDVQSRQVANFDDHDVKILQILADQLAIALENARLYQELEEAYLQAVLSLANAMEVRDSYTGGHSQRLAQWAGAVARQLGCSEEEIQAVHWAALLHDIGKIGVPDAILKKPGELTDEEWEVMKQHPELGAQIVAPVKNLKQVAPLIRYHQEEYIGTGYPYGLRKEEIPLGARILAVVDAYSAITDERVYRKGRSHAEALAEMQRCAGTQFDPQVVKAFLQVIQAHHNRSPSC
jgi:putative nucleotidyltransferase with HDIG domain